jgi:rhomboid protease GluP
VLGEEEMKDHEISNEVEPIQIAEGVYLNVGRVTIILISICCIVYLLDFAFGINDYLAFGAHEPLYTIITSVFAHANIVHLFYNVLNLFIFGNLIELHYGSKSTFVIFITSALIANICFALMEPYSTAIGISGVVYAFIGSAVVLAPHAKIPFPVGAIAFPLQVWFAGPLMALGEFILTFASMDNIAHIAHASGFLVGMIIAVIIKLQERRRTRTMQQEPIVLHLDQ